MAEIIKESRLLKQTYRDFGTQTYSPPQVYKPENELYLWICLDELEQYNHSDQIYFSVLTRSNEASYTKQDDGMPLASFTSFEKARTYAEQKYASQIYGYGIRVSRRALEAAEELEKEVIGTSLPGYDYDSDPDFAAQYAMWLG